jgi:hypothetical protein
VHLISPPPPECVRVVCRFSGRRDLLRRGAKGARNVRVSLGDCLLNIQGERATESIESFAIYFRWASREPSVSLNSFLNKKTPGSANSLAMQPLEIATKLPSDVIVITGRHGVLLAVVAGKQMRIGRTSPETFVCGISPRGRLRCPRPSSCRSSRRRQCHQNSCSGRRAS